MIYRINTALKNAKTVIHEVTRSELVRLAVLCEAGGVWIDPLMILGENLNWIVETYKDFKIWNRLGFPPQVLLNFHPR